MLTRIALFAALATAAAPLTLTSTAHAGEGWERIADLCYDVGNDPLTCRSDDGQLLSTAEFTDTTWNAAYGTDVFAICLAKARQALGEPNWPAEKVRGGCGVTDSYWFPSPTPCPSESFCPRSRQEFLDCCTDHRSLGSSLDDWMKFMTDDGAHIAFEDLYCNCEALLITAD